MSVLPQVPHSDWLIALLLIAGMIALLAISERIHRLYPQRTEALRKFIHIATGVAVLPAPLLFASWLPIFIISMSFAVLNFFSIQRRKLQSIHSVSRTSFGTVYYPLSYALLVALFWSRNVMILSISFALLAFADAMAGMVGKHSSAPPILPSPWDKKSWRGSGAMFVSSTLLVGAGLALFRHTHHFSFPNGLAVAVAIGFFAAATETLSYRGSDNLTVPLLTALGLYMIIRPEMQSQFFFGEGLALGIAWLAFAVKALDASGALATFLMGTIIFGIGAWLFTIPLLLFFVVSSLLSRLPQRSGKPAKDIIAKGSRRDAMQVLANGLLPALMVIGSLFISQEIAFLLFLGGVAAATADTWATEIGLAFGGQPRSIITGKIVAPGTSGGITLAGVIGAIAGAALVAYAGGWCYGVFAKNSLNVFHFIGAAVAGLVANFVDSLLGATLQRRNRCAVCGKVTERAVHCGQPTRYDYGLQWLNNDVVNIACGLSGVLLTEVVIASL
jgi:uncharacterized protein (TIGR00297 family)